MFIDCCFQLFFAAEHECVVFRLVCLLQMISKSTVWNGHSLQLINLNPQQHPGVILKNRMQNYLWFCFEKFALPWTGLTLLLPPVSICWVTTKSKSRRRCGWHKTQTTSKSRKVLSGCILVSVLLCFKAGFSCYPSAVAGLSTGAGTQTINGPFHSS